MKFNKLAGLGITSIVLFGSFGQLAVNPGVAEARPAQETTILAKKSQSLIASGSFVTVEQDHPTNGIAKIVKVNGKRYLEFDKAFTTARGPKVRVVLHRKNNVPVNLKAKNYVTISPLKKFDGTQRYEIPANLDLDDFKSVAIWCERFNVTFGYARMQKA
ncbi:MAG: DM13 domain-containing protein [Sphaerospermopsis sp. SIO1G2]|nr:DM13 domain-containing protein [Sphaerospermopsis sp. SIO1G1]NET70844.1 DM13 domain-containing protein [Sphaerospermopsis sp. SIO1G2]